MQPVTIRRLLVFGICLAGVAALNLTPSMAGSGGQIGTNSIQLDLPTTRPEARTSGANAVPTRSAIPVAARNWPPGAAGATAIHPGTDDQAPGQVETITVVAATPEWLGISWTPANDDVDVVGYQIWLNGFFVLTTQHTWATVRWFNDSSTHIVQVKALDAAGNQGKPGPALLVNRPAPELSPTTEPPPSVQTSPSIEPAQHNSGGNRTADDTTG
ncbi:MAG: hypothetical protein L0H24_10810 [Microlunatus sp.]|nr:hypothetical protein [Microlunatus sp.]